jgi:hypothetical protein
MYENTLVKLLFLYPYSYLGWFETTSRGFRIVVTCYMLKQTEKRSWGVCDQNKKLRQ